MEIGHSIRAAKLPGETPNLLPCFQVGHQNIAGAHVLFHSRVGLRMVGLSRAVQCLCQCLSQSMVKTTTDSLISNCSFYFTVTS